MKVVFRYDTNGFYLAPVVLKEHEPIPQDCTEIRPPDGLYKGKFVGVEWVEGLSQEEIDSIQNRPQPLSELELLKKQQTDLAFELMMKGVI